MLNKILSYFPERAWWNAAIAWPSYIIVIALLCPYGFHWGWRALGIVILIVAILAQIRYFKQNMAGKE
jgi:hypothetical protein